MKKLLGTLFLALLLLVSSASAQIPWVYPLYPFMDVVTFDEWLKIRELSSAPSNESGYGMVYVLSSDGKLYFKDASGATSDLTTGGDGWVDTSGTPVANDFARFTDADTIAGRSYSETAGDLEAEIEIAIDALNNLSAIRAGAAGDVDLFGNATSGETPAFTISGYKSGDAKRTFSVAIGSVSNDTATITGLSYYTFTGRLSATTYASDGSVTDAELKYINTLGSNAQSQINGKQASDTALTNLSSGLTTADRYLRITGTDTFDERTYANVLSDIGAEAADGTIVKDADFASNGILKRTSVGVYGIVTDNSSTWDNAQAGDADLSTLATPTNWRVFYSNGSATITELALGTSGKYLKANGTTSAPTWDTPSGGSGSMTTVEEGDSGVGGADIVTLDFLANDFIIGETPDTEINISIDYVNGQEATTSQTGFLNDTDWDTFNDKAAASHAMSTHSDEDTYNISTSGLSTVTKGYVHGAETTATPSSAFTVDWSAKQVQRVTITGTNLDITFTNPAGPCKLILVVVQGDGDDTIDWTNEADILFPGGVDPTLSTGNGDIDVLSFYFDGTNYLGLFNGNFE